MPTSFFSFGAAALTVTAVAALASASGRLAGQSSIGSDGVAEAFAHLPGREILFRDTGGSGVPIVFLHAGTGSSIVWQHQIAAVRAAGYRFVAYDRLGSGRSVVGWAARPQRRESKTRSRRPWAACGGVARATSTPFWERFAPPIARP